MLNLAKGRRTDHIICVAKHAPVSEKNAAAELAAYLNKITGATFPITESFARKQKVIAVGPGAAIGIGALDKPPAGLGDEGIICRTKGGNLILCGGEGAARGTLYAVHSFLEQDLGCRWWTPTAEYVPRRGELNLPDLDRRFVPVLEYREALYHNTYDEKWAVRNRTNAFRGLTEAWGGSRVYEGFCHTFYSLVPPDAHFKTHPEWFSEVDGTRIAEKGQLCLTNPELTAFVIGELKGRLRGNPRATNASVSQNDWAGNCQCARCRALDNREGSPAGSLIHFVNAVAKGIEDEFPNVAVETLAYMYTRKAPRVRTRHNVTVRLCSYECDFLHSFDHVNNRAFCDDVKAWARICKRLYIWDYVTNFENYVQPHPNWYTLGSNMRFFVGNNVKGVFEQGCHESDGAEMAELRAWVLAKLMWDPTLDAAALISEFLAGYYGCASTYIDAYMKLVYGTVMAIDFYPGSYLIQRCHKKMKAGSPARAGFYLDLATTWDAPFLSAEVILQSLRILAAAGQSVRGNPVLRERVALATLPVLYVLLVRWPEIRRHAKRTGQKWPKAQGRLRVYREFQRIATHNRVTRLKEGGSRDFSWLKKVCSGNASPGP